ncbi:tetratricopeptide repeat protein, partial [Variovorax sp. KK3]
MTLVIAGFGLTAAAGEHEEVERLMQAAKLKEALVRADKFLQDTPRSPQMRFLKGVIQLDLGKQAEAIAIFTQLTRDSPELPEPYNNLAVIYASQGQIDKARAMLETAMRTNPSYNVAYDNLADVYARMAGSAYDKALQVDPPGGATTNPQLRLALLRSVLPAVAPAPPETLAAAGPAIATRAASGAVPPPPPST